MLLAAAAFKPIAQRSSCCGNPRIELVFNEGNWKYEPAAYQSGWCKCLLFLAPSCILQWLQQDRQQQRNITWNAINAHLSIVIGKNLGRIALIQAGLTPKEAQKWPLILEEYHFLSAKVIELEKIQRLAYRGWKVGKAYQISQNYDSTRLCSSKKEKPRRVEIHILHDGLGSCASKQDFNLSIVDELIGLAYTTPVSSNLIKQLAGQVKQSLVSRNIIQIPISALIEHIVFFAKMNSIHFLKPKKWRVIKPLIGRSFEKLNFDELKQLAQNQVYTPTGEPKDFKSSYFSLHSK
jgi:hypothetical protein